MTTIHREKGGIFLFLFFNGEGRKDKNTVCGEKLYLHVNGFPVQGGDKNACTEQSLMKVDGDGFDEVATVTLKLRVFLLVDNKNYICGGCSGSLQSRASTSETNFRRHFYTYDTGRVIIQSLICVTRII